MKLTNSARVVLCEMAPDEATTLDTLVHETGLSEEQVSAALDELLDLGIISENRLMKQP